MQVYKRFCVVFTCFIFLFLSLASDNALAICPGSPEGDLVKIAGHDYTSTSIQDAYNYASDPVPSGLGLSNLTLQLVSGIFIEDLVLDGGAVVLDGGYDCSFTSQASPSSVFGTITIKNGSLHFTAGTDSLTVVSTDQCDFDIDLDGFTRIGSCAGTADDCNDNDLSINPGASEICDGLDNNCDGQIDEGSTPTDADGDGYYAIGSCGAVADDCNDNDPNIFPGAPEIPFDGIDQDCSDVDLTFDNGNACADCHVPDNALDSVHSYRPSATDSSCVLCHAGPVSSILSGHYGRIVRTTDNGVPANSTINCWTCHDNNNHSGGPVAGAFGDGLGDVWNDVAPPYPGNYTCDDCHANRAAWHATATAHNNRVIDSSCASCHTSPSSGTLASDADVDALHGVTTAIDCGICHNYNGTAVDASLVRLKIAQGLSGTQISCLDCHMDKGSNHGGTSGKHPEHLALEGVACDSCHNTTAMPFFISGTDANGDGLFDLNETDVCYLCHQDGTGNPVAGIKADWSTTGGGLGCASCHASFPVTGSHDTHLTQNAISCGQCHDNAAANLTASEQHLDGNIDVYDVNPGDLGYSVDKTIATPYDSCSSTYCHNIGSPQWGGTVSCGDCHAVNGSLAGMHGSHYDSLNNVSDMQAANNSTADSYVFTCGVCHDTSHPSYMGHSTGPVNADPAQNQTAEVYFDTVVAGGPVGGIGWYTGNTYDVDPVGFPWTDQECGNMYCHSPGNKNAAPYDGAPSTPNWVTGFSGECIECHYGDALTIRNMATGSHLSHIYGDDWIPPLAVRNKMTCDRCHDNTATGTRTIKDKSQHVNRSIDIAFDTASDPQGTGQYLDTASHTVDLSSKTPGSTPGDCSNLYCHSQGTSVTAPYPAPNYVNPTWGMDPLEFKHPEAVNDSCNGCHGGYTVAPVGMDTNAHQAHIENVDNVGFYIGCSWCHRSNKSTGMRVQVYENHVNALVEVKFKNDPTEGGRVLDSDAPSYAGQSTAGPDYLNDTARVVPDPVTKYDCSNVYCHSNGNLIANVDNITGNNGLGVGEGTLADPVTGFKTITWDETTTIGCDGCHGDGAGRAHPTYANGGAATMTANSHERHVTDAQINCTVCHQETVTDTNIPPTGGINTSFWPNRHLNRLEDVSMVSLAGTTPDAYEAEGVKACTSVYCHSNGEALVTGTALQTQSTIFWGGASLTCNSCHNTSDATNNLGPDYPNGTNKANSHAAHQGYGCQACHSSTTSDGSTIANVANHVNQVYDVVAGAGVTFSYSFSTTGGTCSNISCHGNNDAVWGQTVEHPVQVDTEFDLSNGTLCSTCHVVANWAEIEGIEHNVATNGAGSCATCHNSSRQDVIDTIANVNGFNPINCISCHSDKTVAHGSVDHTGNNLVTLSSQCASCHDPGSAANATVDVTHSGDCNLCHTASIPDLESGLSAGTCVTCHGSDVGTVHPSCTTCHGEPPNGSSSPNRDRAHSEHAVIGFGSTSPSCNACHSGASHNGSTEVGILSSFDDKSSGLPGFNGSTCSNLSCHGGKTTPNWATGTLNVNTQCESCHDFIKEGTPPEYTTAYSGKHYKHMGEYRSEGKEVEGCTDCHSTSKLATGHFSNLQTTTFEQDPATTIGGSGTRVNSWGGTWSKGSCSTSCH